MTEIRDDKDREPQGERPGYALNVGSNEGELDSQIEQQESAPVQEEKVLISQMDEGQTAGSSNQGAEAVSPLPAASINTKPKSSLKKNLLIFFGVLAGVVLLGIIGSSIGGGFSSDKEWTNPKSPYVAVVYVEGGIYSGQKDSFGSATGYQHHWTLDRMDEFISDENNRGILLFIDSPGGGVYESDELYLKLKEYQDHTDRPVYAAMGSMAASGGYYIAAAADQIYANRNTWTGSIGVTIGTFYDISDLLTRYGIKTTTITAGENKAMGSMVEPLTPEQKAIFQSLVDEAYEQFTGIVATERDMPLDVIKTLADGRVYTAKQALEAGLIDVIGTSEEALYDLFDDYDLWDCEVIDVYYQDNSFWGRLFANINIPDGASSDIGALLNFVDQSGNFPISYECKLIK